MSYHVSKVPSSMLTPSAKRALAPALVGFFLALFAAGCAGSGGNGGESAGAAGQGGSQGGNQAGGPANSGNTVSSTDNSVSITVTGAARFTLVGRFDTRNPQAPAFNIMGSKIGVSFTGTSLTAMLTDTGSDSLDVFVDSAAPVAIHLNPSVTPVAYPLVTNLPPGKHVAWLTKRTEFSQRASDGNNIAVGTITLNDMVTDLGESFYTPPAGKPHRIEALGDSSFTGYAVDVLCGDNPSDPNHSCNYISNRYSPRTQNVTKSVPGVAAAYLDADLSNVSYTGEGVVYSFYDPGNCNVAANQTKNCLPTIWNQTLPASGALAYPFDQQIDVVLMSAGGDDLDDKGSFGGTTESFTAAYAAWLGQIRTRYPRATIVSTLSPAAANNTASNSSGPPHNDIETLGGALQTAVARAQAAQPGGTDPNMLYFNYYTGTPYTTYKDIASGLNFYYGGYGHSSAQGSAWLGQRLAAFVAAHMGWTMVQP